MFPFGAVCINPKKSFDIHHIWLAPPGTIIVPTLLVTYTTVKCNLIKSVHLCHLGAKQLENKNASPKFFPPLFQSFVFSARFFCFKFPLDPLRFNSHQRNWHTQKSKYLGIWQNCCSGQGVNSSSTAQRGLWVLILIEQDLDSPKNGLSFMGYYIWPKLF